MSKKIFFVSGLPRSGSTLLMNLLGQNPNHYVTPTSGLIELFLNPKLSWKNIAEFQAEGLEIVQPRIINVMKNIIYGYFEKEFNEDKVVFDKSRGWLQYIEFLEASLGHEVKVIVTVRDIRAIAASFEKLYRKRDIDFIQPQGPEFFKHQTVYGRTEVLLSESGVVGLSVNRLRDAISRMPGRLIIIPYRHLTTDPKAIMKSLHKQLDLKPFKYDPDNVKQITKENDLVHGMDLHKIRTKVAREEGLPWAILPNDLRQQIDQQFNDINQIC